jgi:hypothetical protein
MSEFDVARHGAWWVRIRRVDVKAFPDSGPLFFWTVGHDGAGELWSGFRRDADAAADEAMVRFDRMKEVG